MSVKSREKIALAVFAALIVLSLLGLGWYLVAGHSWNVAASNIDDTFGSMDGYTAIVYEGTAVPQTAAEKAAEAAKEEKAAKGAAGSASSDEKGSHELDPDGKRTSGSFPKRMLLRRRSKRNRMRARRRERARTGRARSPSRP